MIDTLIIESYAHYVHLATAGEIAISELSQDKTSGFVFIHSESPDHPFFTDDLLRLISYKMRGLTYRNLVFKIEKKLRSKKVRIFKESSLSRKLKEDIKQFSLTFPDNIEDLKQYEYKGAKLGLAVVSSLISRTRKSSPDIKKYSRLVRLYLHESALVFEKSKLTLERIKPQTIISFNGRFACCKPIFEAASQLGIEFQFHERGSTFEKYEIFERMPHDFDYIRQEIKEFWTTSQLSYEIKSQQAHDFFRLKRAGDGIGWSSFVDKQDRGLVPHGVQKQKIVYFSSSDDEFAAVGDFYKKRIFNDQINAINTLITWVSDKRDSTLVIRVHPHLQQKHQSDRDLWCSLSGENVILIPPESPIDSYALIDWSDIVVTYGSTMGVEAAYWGKPSILLGESLYSYFGCAYEPKSLDKLFTLLNSKNLKELEQETCLPYGFYFMSYGKPYKYYRPETLFTGKFLGDRLTFYPEWLDTLYKLTNHLRSKKSI